MRPKSICFIGLDGSGKSTAISFALKWCEEHNINAEIVRAAYVIEKSKWLVSIGKKATMHKHSDPYKKGDYANYLEQMRKTNRKSLKYRIFSCITTHEFKQQIRERIIKKQKQGINLLIDRYIYDNAVTYAANLGLGQEYIVDTLTKKWKKAPIPDCLVYVKTPINVCLSRKDDIPDPLYLEIREPLYDLVANLYNARCVDGQKNIDEFKKDIIRICEEVFING